jgi:hypothetical protein
MNFVWRYAEKCRKERMLYPRLVWQYAEKCRNAVVPAAQYGYYPHCKLSTPVQKYTCAKSWARALGFFVVWHIDLRTRGTRFCALGAHGSAHWCTLFCALGAKTVCNSVSIASGGRDLWLRPPWLIHKWGRLKKTNNFNELNYLQRIRNENNECIHTVCFALYRGPCCWRGWRLSAERSPLFAPFPPLSEDKNEQNSRHRSDNFSNSTGNPTGERRDVR